MKMNENWFYWMKQNYLDIKNRDSFVFWCISKNLIYEMNNCWRSEAVGQKIKHKSVVEIASRLRFRWQRQARRFAFKKGYIFFPKDKPMLIDWLVENNYKPGNPIIYEG